MTRSLVLACLLCLVFLLLVSLLAMGYLCPDSVCALSSGSLSQSRYQTWSKLAAKHAARDNMGKELSFVNGMAANPFASRSKLSFDEMQRDESFVFDIKGDDVMVFLHIQKTGGTSFGRHLVKDLDLETPCECKKGRKRCKCVRPSESGVNKFWLFSRYSTGWKCGLHADWTELTNCVDNAMDESEKVVTKRRYFYVTLLREPVGRFLSEFKHVQRGATWKSARHYCGGRSATSHELPPCYNSSDWSGVSLRDFISCPHNLAFNRQTRMLADLSLVGCYDKSLMTEEERNILLLASAKENLRRMAFFGLCEFQKNSQYLFEATFKLRFLRPFIQLNETHSSLSRAEIDPIMLNKIRQLNHLDIELYEYAKNLLAERFQETKKLDKNFDDNYNHLIMSPIDDEDAPETKLLKKMRALSQNKLKKSQASSKAPVVAPDQEDEDDGYLDDVLSDDEKSDVNE